MERWPRIGGECIGSSQPVQLSPESLRLCSIEEVLSDLGIEIGHGLKKSPFEIVRELVWVEWVNAEPSRPLADRALLLRCFRDCRPILAEFSDFGFIHAFEPIQDRLNCF